jgi:hypothetical protein
MTDSWIKLKKNASGFFERGRGGGEIEKGNTWTLIDFPDRTPRNRSSAA